MRTRVIFNPHSGRNNGRAALGERLRAALAQSGLPGEVVATKHRGHATQLAREAVAAGYARVIVAGGDGTFNEAALALAGTPVTLAAVPCGSGNGLARHLGIPLRERAATSLALSADARVRAIDAGMAAGRPFFNVMGVGLDADIGARFNTLSRRGPRAYLAATWRGLRAARPISLRVRDALDHVRFAGEVLIAAAANSDQYGNNARIAPGARADDGVLALVLVLPGPLVSSALLACRLLAGTFDRAARVRRFDLSAASLELTAPTRLHTDGEIHLAGSVIDLATRPACLRVVVPSVASP